MSERESLSKTEKKILSSARQVFARKGYHKAVVEEIAQQADVGKGTVYRHFGNKSELFSTLIREITRSMALSVKEALAGTDSPRRQLEMIFEEHLNLYEEARPMVEIMVNEGLEPTGIRDNDLVSEWDEYLNIVREVFAAGLKNGDFDCPPPAKSARLYISFIWGVLHEAIVFKIGDLRAEYSAEFMDVILNGVSSCDKN